ncbi:SusC/RagA family TonB-linked outer membrane protein [Mucilaginibacter calamicampi]|uniref:SusC/RagA family TonB-linked outer membrane protein n=1 Tax=Mucilaginibacter calamicampi TaxID=1302352 RepID=A0ABW2YUQ8_9SPHI
MLRAWTVLSKNSVIAKSIAAIVLVNVTTNYATAAGGAPINTPVLLQQQNVTITGTVTDETNQPLPGVSVMVRGTSIGVVTGGNGKYSLSVPGNAAITFSVLGYQTQEIAAGSGAVINVKLIPVQTQLDEVVVVGYGEQKKATLTGSVSTVKGEELTKNPSPNLAASLQGKLPGLTVSQRSGEPGRDNPDILIRGGGTLGGNNNNSLNGPLYVIDGVPSSQSRQDYVGRMNPEDIESISVLKDGSAAIYGNRAANGVILITTKKGTKGKAQLSYTYNYAFQSPTKIPQMLDAVEFAKVYNEGVAYRGGTAPFYSADVIQQIQTQSNPYVWGNTNWTKEVLKSYAPEQRQNIQVTGGSDNSRYLLSFGTLTQDNLFRNNPTKVQQYNVRTNISVDISKYLTVGANISGIILNRTYSNITTGTNFVNILQANPTLIARYPNGLLGGGRLGENPLLLDSRGSNKEQNYPITSTFTGTFKVPWVSGLKFDVSFNYDLNNRYTKTFSSPYFYYDYNVTTQQNFKVNSTNLAELTERYDQDRTLLYNYRATYDKNFGQHHINVMVGGEQQQNDNNWFNAYRKNFLSTQFPQLRYGSNAAADKNNDGIAGRSAYNNFLGRASYDFASKYIFDFNFRYDGSQIFKAGDRYGFFPSFQGAWRISEEDFFKAAFPFVDQLKIRATYGELGSDRTDGGAYQYAQFYTFANNVVFGSSDVGGIQTAVLPNPTFTWERSKKTDFGIEGSLWKGLFGFDFTYFKERRSSILTQRNFSASKVLGFIGLPPENIGIVDNNGFELILSHRNKIGQLFYNLSFNAAYARNTVVFTDEVPNTYAYRNAQGHPFGAPLLYQADGIFNTQAELDSYPHQPNQKLGDIKVLDLNNDGKIDGNDQFRFDYNNVPKYTFGMNINLQYKQFDMNIGLYGQTKAYNYDGAFANLGNQDFSNASVYRAADRWTPSNPNGTMPRSDAYQPGNTTFFNNNATFIRLRSTELGYTVPISVLSKLKISSVRVFVSGFNLLTWSPKIKWSDPEISGAGLNNGSFVNYPPQKIINLGANVRF